jgi:uncharacterized protein YbjT (DUF2867 family)
VIVLTGAAGKTGRAILAALHARGVPAELGAQVYRPEQAKALQASGVSRVVAGDMRDAAVLARAFEGASVVYHICPNMSPDELEITKVAVEAARSAGVERIVYHSVLHPQTKAMAHHWAKLRTEEMLFETGLPFTILQPGAYMQNLLANWEDIASGGVYAVPYGAEARISMVDLHDVAAAAAIVLTQPGHENAIYELAGPQALSQLEVAEILSRVLERPVRFKAIPLEEWEQGARNARLGGYALETLVSMFRYYDRHGLVGNSNVLERLLDRPPSTFEGFVRGLVTQES